MSDDTYPSNAVNVLTIQNGITFLTSLTSLVTRTPLARAKIKGPVKRVGTLCRKNSKYYTLDTMNIFKRKVKKTGEKVSVTEIET